VDFNKITLENTGLRSKLLAAEQQKKEIDQMTETLRGEIGKERVLPPPPPPSPPPPLSVPHTSHTAPHVHPRAVSSSKRSERRDSRVS
jgi:hypothetical protein